MSPDEVEFKCYGACITRRDYESMPCPMCASELDDETMQKIADDTYELLLSDGWDSSEIESYIGHDRDGYVDGDMTAEALKDDFWRCMEKAAIDNGMRYYEDIETDGKGDQSGNV